MSSSMPRGMLLLCLVYAEALARSTLRGKSSLLDPSHTETEELLKMLQEKSTSGFPLQRAQDAESSVTKTDSATQSKNEFARIVHEDKHVVPASTSQAVTDVELETTRLAQHRFAGHAVSRSDASRSEAISDTSRSTDSASLQGSTESKTGAQTLPKWLEKPPYWLPTPPEWGPPPAHIFSSWYAPRTIPQPVFKPSLYSYAPGMYEGGSAPAYVPSPMINEHNVYAPIGPAAWRPIAPGVPSVLMEVEEKVIRVAGVHPVAQRAKPEIALTSRLADVLQLHAALISEDAQTREAADVALRTLASTTLQADHRV